MSTERTGENKRSRPAGGRPLSQISSRPTLRQACSATGGSTSTRTVAASSDTRPPTGLELWITDPILDAELSPLAKLIPAAIAQPGPYRTLDDFERILPARRRKIVEAIRELEREGFVSIARPSVRERGTGRYAHASIYRLSASAHTRSGIGVYFTRLLPVERLGSSASRWILRAVYLREQRIAGAIQLPDAVAARLAGTSPEAVARARRAWGDVRQIRARRTNAPAVYVIEGNTTHPAQPERFDPDRRRVEAVAGIELWGTRNQTAKVTGEIERSGGLVDGVLDQLRSEQQPVDARRALALIERSTLDDSIPA